MKNIKLKKDEQVFCNAVSMKVSKEQFQNDLKTPLELLGYQNNIVAFGEWLVLSTNWNGVHNVISCVDQLNKEQHFREFIGSYNPQLFLELASSKMLQSELDKLRSKKETSIEVHD